jgi:hypothetical protein
MQESDHGRPQLTTAYARVVAAQVSLNRGRWEALFGTSYDPDTYDALILEYRAARQALATAVGIQEPSQHRLDRSLATAIA